MVVVDSCWNFVRILLSFAGVLLDFILKFLEGEHVKSKRLTEANRSTVLGLVKSAISWKTAAPRSSQEVQEYIQKLNNVMGEIVRRM